jgi:hypothetical protein
VSAIRSAVCANCSAPLSGQYCARCGQKIPRPDLTLSELLHETIHEVFDWDGKLPKTLKALFFAPGLLTADFLAGRRARWLPPLRLYLICSLAFFFTRPVVEHFTHRSEREIASITIVNPDGTRTLTPDGRREIEQSLPGRLFGVERIERAVASNARLNEMFLSVFPKAMFVLLPVFAMLTRLAWGRSLPRYPAHFYPALRLHAALFGTLTLQTVLGALSPSQTVELVIAIVLLAYVLVYGLLFVHRVFGDSWGTTILKALAVGCAYTICLNIVSFGMLAYVVFTT